MGLDLFNFFNISRKPSFKQGGNFVEATPEQIEERWEKKKEAIETLANNIRRLRLNVTNQLKEYTNE